MRSAPDFSLPDQNKTLHSLNDYKGKWLIVYFYPKDDTPGCTKEACSFQNSLSLFEQKGVAVLGISKDTTGSHSRFANKFGLQFPLLSDKSLTTIQAFGAWGPKKFMGREFDGIIRRTYLINPTGEIIKEYPQVDPTVHTEEIIKDLASFGL